MRRVQIIGALCLAVVGCLVGAVGASAAPGDPFQYRSSFGESIGTTFGNIAVNHQTGHVLVAAADGNVYQFNAEGDPVEFPAVNSSKLPGSAPVGINFYSGGQVAVDNSGGPTQGNFYTWDGTYLRTHHADGSPIGESALVGESMGPGVFAPGLEGLTGPNIYFGYNYPQSIAVGPDGTLWLFAFYDEAGCATCAAEGIALTPEGTLAGPKFIASNTTTNGSAAFDNIGHLYLTSYDVLVTRLDAENGFTVLGEVNLGSNGDTRQIAVDPSTNDIFRVADTSRNPGGIGFNGYVTSTQSNSSGSTPVTDVLNSSGGLRATGGLGFDATGQTLYLSENGKVHIFHREPPSAPRGLAAPQVREVRSRAAVLESSLIDGGAATKYRFEYGPTTSYGAVSEQSTAPRNYFLNPVRGGVDGLEPNTTYHFRIVATNSVGTAYGPDGTFTTYPATVGADPCPNALARKQTVAQRLPDCRAYELISAADTGGYDVESSLVPGQTPFPGFSLAKDRLLYAIHSGAVPGPWSATNKGPDPYLATRTGNGWVTDYKGFPSNLNSEAGSFSSVLGEADSQLNTLAFAGANLCNPCFTSGGLATGIPVRLPSGQLVQGMSGSLVGSVPASAKPEGKVAKYFSGDGRKLLFASKYAFELGANVNPEPSEAEPEPPVSLTVYERDLGAGTTEIVSTDPSGNALTGTVSELDVSTDGSRVVVGKGISTDSAGNEYVHPYLHIAGRPGSIDLAPLASAGVLYDGMTSDGSKVFFTSANKLAGSDPDASADLYEADVDGSGNLDLKAITAGSDSDACNPVANANGEHWNTTTGTADCSAVAISGGGGVASVSGAIYLLSPEQLDGSKGTADQPNLYLAEPGGSISFVATLEPNNPLVLDSVKAATARRTADFQTTPSGGYAAFTTAMPLSGANTHGFRAVFRYAAGSGRLDCVSCDKTGTSDPDAFADAELPPNGLALLEDGRLFFTTVAQLVNNDPNVKKDVYEWSGDNPQLISSGTGPFDSALLTASADGTDVFIFTHDNLATGEDRNGAQMRIYDAREGGGFFKLPPPVPCQASDECHGPGAPAGSVPDVRSSGKTTMGNVLVCAKNRVKKRGQCVKKKQAHAKKKHRKHAKKRKAGTKKRDAAATGKRGGRNA